MNKEQIFSIVKEGIIEVIPELADKPITITDSLKELGANSVDRAEILIRTMAACQLKVPLIKFAEAKNIEELVSIVMKKLQQS